MNKTIPKPSLQRLLPVALAASMLTAYAGSVLAADVANLTGIKKVVQTASQGGATWSAAQLRSPLSAGSSVRTGDQSAAEITYGDGSIFRMAALTTLTLQAQENRFLKLLLGKLWFKQKKGSGTFKVQTPSVVASISSNEEVVDVDDSGRSRVVVLDTDTDKPVIVQPIDANGNPVGSPITLLTGQDAFVNSDGHASIGSVNVEDERSRSPGNARFGNENTNQETGDAAQNKLNRLNNDLSERVELKLNDIQQTGGSPTSGSVTVEVK